MRDLAAGFADDEVAVADVEGAAERSAERAAMAFLLGVELRKRDGEGDDAGGQSEHDQPANEVNGTDAIAGGMLARSGALQTGAVRTKGNISHFEDLSNRVIAKIRDAVLVFGFNWP